jgi:hypothetical protein
MMEAMAGLMGELWRISDDELYIQSFSMWCGSAQAICKQDVVTSR